MLDLRRIGSGRKFIHQMKLKTGLKEKFYTKLQQLELFRDKKAFPNNKKT